MQRQSEELAKGYVITRRYREDTMTPYEKLKSFPEANRYLKAGLTFPVSREVCENV